MQSFTAGQANTVVADVIGRSDGNPIVSGTVAAYLVARSGSHAGKWFRASDASWQSSESSAGAMAHESDGHWTASIAAAAWIAGVRYSFYARESGERHIPYSDELVEISTPVEFTVETEVVR
jgi:hypothetical protein